MRKADTYRGARRNAARGGEWFGITGDRKQVLPRPKYFPHPPVRPNRAQRWIDKDKALMMELATNPRP